ncbi:MAG: thiamine pyrophosphate-dependent enzyme, partial [Chloroflexota bacterium]
MVATRQPATRRRRSDEMVDTAGIPPETLLEIYETMCLSKAMDDRIWVLTRSGEIALAVTCHGHEALQVASIFALRRGYDWMVPYYRDSAAALAMGLKPRDMMLAFFARKEDSFSG